MPQLTRAHYQRELGAWALLPIMVGVVEGGIVSMMAKIAFEKHVTEVWLNFAVAVLAGAPAFSNITSFLWAALSHGRHKIKFLYGLKLATAVSVALIALVPLNLFGLLMLTICVVFAKSCWTGVVTIRSAVWRANYPRNARANMAGKLATVQSLAVAAIGFILAEAMGWREELFRVVYPLAAVCGLFGAHIYRGLRVRGHRALLNAERAESSKRALVNPLLMLRVLREDRDYRAFMFWMFIFGTGNMMITAPLVIMLRDIFGMNYREGMLISGIIPIVLMPLAIPVWAKLLDNVHIIRFRAIHSWTFVLAAAAMLLAAVTHQPMWFWLSATIQGFAFGGGVLAWNLGHHDFAPAHKASQYMGVHVTLTGIRGFLAPLLAVGVYQWLNDMHSGAGVWVFALCLALNISGAVGFGMLQRRMLGPGGKAKFDEGPPVQPPAAG